MVLVIFLWKKKSQVLLSNQWGLSTLSAKVPWNQCHGTAMNILISFQHLNYIDDYSPQSTSPGNRWISTSSFVLWNGLFSNVGKYLKFCFIILITIFWYRYSFISFFFDRASVMLWPNQCGSQIHIGIRSKLIFSDLRIHVFIGLSIRGFSPVLWEHWTIQYSHHF